MTTILNDHAITVHATALDDRSIEATLLLSLSLSLSLSLYTIICGENPITQKKYDVIRVFRKVDQYERTFRKVK